MDSGENNMQLQIHCVVGKTLEGLGFECWGWGVEGWYLIVSQVLVVTVGVVGLSFVVVGNV